jgi:hypothetical protein
MTWTLTARDRVMGIGIAWRLKDQSKIDFLSSNRTQTGQNKISPCPSCHATPSRTPTLPSTEIEANVRRSLPSGPQLHRFG